MQNVLCLLCRIFGKFDREKKLIVSWENLLFACVTIKDIGQMCFLHADWSVSLSFTVA